MASVMARHSGWQQDRLGTRCSSCTRRAVLSTLYRLLGGMSAAEYSSPQHMPTLLTIGENNLLALLSQLLCFQEQLATHSILQQSQNV